MAEFVTLDNVSAGDIFPNVNFEIFPQFLHQCDESLLSELPAFTDDIQEKLPAMTTASLMASQIPRTETLQVELSDKVQRQHSIPDENIPLATPLGLEESRFPVVSTEEITDINESAASKNTKRTTQTWLTVWMKWCKARNIDDKIERYSPQALDEVLKKFYVEVRKKDGSEYEPDSLRVMQASIDRYLRQKNYPDSIISGREFKKSQETLNSKAKLLRYQGKGKRPNRAQPYSRVDEEIFWTEGKLGNHNGVALTNVNFKNLSEHMGFRGRQDHYNAYVEDFTILQMADGDKVVQFEENPTKTRQGGLRNKTRSSPQQMWCTDGSERDPVRLFEEWLKHRPDAMKNSGPLYLAIIPRPNTSVWYAKSRMGEHRISQIMKSIASCLPEDCTKKITNHSTRKTVVAKLKEAGQPRHKIIQVTGHARESSLDDYDEITEDERRQLSHIASGYVATKSSSSSVNSVQACTSTSTASSGMESLQPATLPESVMKENIPTNPPGMLPFYMPTQSLQMATKHLQQAPLQVFNQCVFNNAFSDSSRPKPRKRRVIIDSDSD